METDLIVLLAVQTFFISAFARFAIELPLWQKLLKWLVFDAVFISLIFMVGHWALIFLAAGLIPGAVVHIIWCRKHGIDPVQATPRRRYYELRGWRWVE